MDPTSYFLGALHYHMLSNVPLASLEPWKLILIFLGAIVLTFIVFFFINRKSKREVDEIIRKCEESAQACIEETRRVIARAKKKEPKEQKELREPREP